MASQIRLGLGVGRRAGLSTSSHDSADPFGSEVAARRSRNGISLGGDSPEPSHAPRGLSDSAFVVATRRLNSLHYAVGRQEDLRHRRAAEYNSVDEQYAAGATWLYRQYLQEVARALCLEGRDVRAACLLLEETSRDAFHDMQIQELEESCFIILRETVTESEASDHLAHEHAFERLRLESEMELVAIHRTFEDAFVLPRSILPTAFAVQNSGHWMGEWDDVPMDLRRLAMHGTVGTHMARMQYTERCVRASIAVGMIAGQLEFLEVSEALRRCDWIRRWEDELMDVPEVETPDSPSNEHRSSGDFAPAGRSSAGATATDGVAATSRHESASSGGEPRETIMSSLAFQRLLEIETGFRIAIEDEWTCRAVQALIGIDIDDISVSRFVASSSAAPTIAGTSSNAGAAVITIRWPERGNMSFVDVGRSSRLRADDDSTDDDDDDDDDDALVASHRLTSSTSASAFLSRISPPSAALGALQLARRGIVQRWRDGLIFLAQLMWMHERELIARQERRDRMMFQFYAFEEEREALAEASAPRLSETTVTGHSCAVQ